MGIKVGELRRLLNHILPLFVWIMFAFNLQNRDRIVYELIYQGNYQYHEPLFMLLCKIFNKIGFSYQQFYFTVASFCIILIYYFLKKNAKNAWLFWVMFIFYPLPIFITVLRSSILICCVLYSLKYLDSENNYNILKYIVIIIILSGIHYSAILYLPFIFAKVKNKKALLIYCIFFSFLGVFISYTGIIEKIVLYFANSPKIVKWFSQRGGWGVVLSFILHIYTYFIFLFSYKKLHNAAIKKRTFLEIAYNINSISFIYFVLYMFNSQFLGRIYMLIVILNYVIIAETFTNKNIIWLKKEKNLYIFLVAGQIIFWTAVLYRKDYIELFGYLFQNLLL